MCHLIVHVFLCSVLAFIVIWFCMSIFCVCVYSCVGSICVIDDTQVCFIFAFVLIFVEYVIWLCASTFCVFIFIKYVLFVCICVYLCKGMNINCGFICLIFYFFSYHCCGERLWTWISLKSMCFYRQLYLFWRYLLSFFYNFLFHVICFFLLLLVCHSLLIRYLLRSPVPLFSH